MIFVVVVIAVHYPFQCERSEEKGPLLLHLPTSKPLQTSSDPVGKRVRPGPRPVSRSDDAVEDGPRIRRPGGQLDQSSDVYSGHGV